MISAASLVLSRQLFRVLPFACMLLCSSCASLPEGKPNAASQAQADAVRLDARAAQLLSAPLAQEDATELALLRNPVLAAQLGIIGIEPAQRLLVAHTLGQANQIGSVVVSAEPRIERTLTANMASWLGGRLLQSSAGAGGTSGAAAAMVVGDGIFAVRRT